MDSGDPEKRGRGEGAEKAHGARRGHPLQERPLRPQHAPHLLPLPGPAFLAPSEGNPPVVHPSRGVGVQLYKLSPGCNTSDLCEVGEDGPGSSPGSRSQAPSIHWRKAVTG